MFIISKCRLGAAAALLLSLEKHVRGERGSVAAAMKFAREEEEGGTLKDIGFLWLPVISRAFLLI